jgi:tRNA pseudouridine-54 N-methylase
VRSLGSCGLSIPDTCFDDPDTQTTVAQTTVVLSNKTVALSLSIHLSCFFLKKLYRINSRHFKLYHLEKGGDLSKVMFQKKPLAVIDPNEDASNKLERKFPTDKLLYFEDQALLNTKEF